MSLAKAVGDTEFIRRQNRALVLEELRQNGPQSRTSMASATGLSHASITAITAGLIEQNVLEERIEANAENTKSRGRPAILVGQNRGAAYILVVEIEPRELRVSLVDNAGILSDRLSVAIRGVLARDEIWPMIQERVSTLLQRNEGAPQKLAHVAVSVQGIMNAQSDSMLWSPVSALIDFPIVQKLADETGVKTSIYKRSGLLADGIRWLFPDLAKRSVACVYVGSTVAMGMTNLGTPFGQGHGSGHGHGQSQNAATEFGHMNHQPDGALCRCGRRGCIEAYASNYGVLRTTIGVPEHSAPAPHVPLETYEELIQRAQAGDRNAVRAFNLAGSAIGFGISRIMTVFDPSHIVIVGPGAAAFDLMKENLETGIAASLLSEVGGMPEIRTHLDSSQPVFKGICLRALSHVDRELFAPMPAIKKTVSKRAKPRQKKVSNG